MKNLSSVCDKFLEDKGTERDRDFKDNSDVYDKKYSAVLDYRYREGLIRIDVKNTVGKTISESLKMFQKIKKQYLTF